MLKRLPLAPREARTVSTSNNAPQTLTPIPYGPSPCDRFCLVWGESATELTLCPRCVGFALVQTPPSKRRTCSAACWFVDREDAGAWFPSSWRKGGGIRGFLPTRLRSDSVWSGSVRSDLGPHALPAASARGFLYGSALPVLVRRSNTATPSFYSARRFGRGPESVHRVCLRRVRRVRSLAGTAGELAESLILSCSSAVRWFVHPWRYHPTSPDLSAGAALSRSRSRFVPSPLARALSPQALRPRRRRQRQR